MMPNFLRGRVQAHSRRESAVQEIVDTYLIVTVGMGSRFLRPSFEREMKHS